jgi:hypothetical protein
LKTTYITYDGINKTKPKHTSSTKKKVTSKELLSEYKKPKTGSNIYQKGNSNYKATSIMEAWKQAKINVVSH